MNPKAIRGAQVYCMVVLLLMAGAACTTAITRYRIESPASVPRATYTLYLYEFGGPVALRAVLMKSPRSRVEVVPYSTQIITATGDFDDALAFMTKGVPNRVNLEAVKYREEEVGYLLTYERGMEHQSIQVNLFERDGKVYFGVFEKGYTDY